MWDLNEPADVIEAMRDGGMTDEDIKRVCQSVLYALEYVTEEI